MRTPHMRVTVLELMAALLVASTVLPVVAVIVWPLNSQQARLRALISDYNAKAAHHAELEGQCARLAQFSDTDRGIVIRDGQRICVPVGRRPELVPKYLELAKYHRALKEKYERATLHPRLPIEPDQTPPEL